MEEILFTGNISFGLRSIVRPHFRPFTRWRFPFRQMAQKSTLKAFTFLLNQPRVTGSDSSVRFFKGLWDGGFFPTFSFERNKKFAQTYRIAKSVDELKFLKGFFYSIREWLFWMHLQFQIIAKREIQFWSELFDQSRSCPNGIFRS